MSRNSAEDFAQRLYARLPGHYRVYDAERGQPLLHLVQDRLALRLIQLLRLRQGELIELWIAEIREIA